MASEKVDDISGISTKKMMLNKGTEQKAFLDEPDIELDAQESKIFMEELQKPNPKAGKLKQLAEAVFDKRELTGEIVAISKEMIVKAKEED